MIHRVALTSVSDLIFGCHRPAKADLLISQLAASPIGHQNLPCPTSALTCRLQHFPKFSPSDQSCAVADCLLAVWVFFCPPLPLSPRTTWMLGDEVQRRKWVKRWHCVNVAPVLAGAAHTNTHAHIVSDMALTHFPLSALTCQRTHTQTHCTYNLLSALQSCPWWFVVSWPSATEGT